MPLGINGYNDAFKAFTDFATQAKSGSTIAQIGGEKNTVAGTGPLAGRTIVAKTGFDFIGNVGRRQASRDVNNAVRDLFKQAIADMFGGPDKIPESVRDAMKMADFGKGKPLTARRILAVKTAVDQVAAKTSNCIAESKAHFEYTKEGKEEGDKRIDTAFAACNGNADAMDIVKANIRPLTVNTQSSLRPEADVQKKVGRLLDNLNELKEVSKNNPAIYAAGKKMLEETGVSLPKGMIAKLVQTANDAPLKAFGKLSGGSSVMDIHKAVMQMHKTIKTAMSSSGAEKLDGADEKMGARDFVAAALLSRCGKGGLANIRKALDSQNASALNEYYSFSDAGRNGLVENPSDDLKEGIKVVGRIGLTYLEKLDNAVNDNLRELNPGAHEESRVKKFEGEFDIDDFGGDELVDDTVSIANDINDELVQNFVDATVQGSGKGSEAIKNVIRTKLDGSNDPGEKLGKRLSANANAMMNWSIGGEMKKLAADGGESSQFKKDIVRNYNVTMSDGEKTFKLSNDFEKARDELAQFVTGDPKATYKGLAEAANKVAETAADKAAVQKAASDRNKVHLLMALISQETEKAGENGAEHAMDPREAEGAFTITGFSKHDRLHGIGADASRTFVVAKRADGGIDLNYTMDKPLKEVDDGTTDGDGYKVGDGSKFVCKLDYTLKGAEFNRLAQLDFGKFDDSEGKKIYDKKIDMPDGTRQFREHKLEKVVDSFPEEFKVKADCRMDFTLTLNPTDEEKIAAQRDAGPIVA